MLPNNPPYNPYVDGERYRCVAGSVEGFVQQLAVQYVAHGYFWYVAGHIGQSKDARAIDRKLVEKYEVALSKQTRVRLRAKGYASVQYLRHENFFVLIATEGEHRLREEEVLRDLRRVPIRYAGYSISFRQSKATGKGHASVRIAALEYRELRKALLANARYWSVDRLSAEFYLLPFEPYAPIRRQFLNLLRAVNRVRSVAGLDLVPSACLHLRRRIVRPFEEGVRRIGVSKEAA